MKLRTTNSLSLAVLAGIALTSPAFAVVNIEYVSVGNAGNAADPATGSLYGAVAYAYNIGKYEVTNAQYTEFLNAVDPTGANARNLYNPNMGIFAQGGISLNATSAIGSRYETRTNMSDKPAAFVGVPSAYRFANWLNNGQGSADTETGAYTIGSVVTRNVGATVFLPDENEWYKAAYYDPTPGAGGGDNYWLYATQSNSTPSASFATANGDIVTPGANVINYGQTADWNGTVNGNVTTVGSAGSESFYGAADMSGNLGEMLESPGGDANGQILRGGAWSGFGTAITSSGRTPGQARGFLGGNNVGFRVASIPEPSAALLSVVAVGASLLRRRRNSI